MLKLTSQQPKYDSTSERSMQMDSLFCIYCILLEHTFGFSNDLILKNEACKEANLYDICNCVAQIVIANNSKVVYDPLTSFSSFIQSLLDPIIASFNMKYGEDILVKCKSITDYYNPSLFLFALMIQATEKLVQQEQLVHLLLLLLESSLYNSSSTALIITLGIQCIFNHKSLKKEHISISQQYFKARKQSVLSNHEKPHKTPDTQESLIQERKYTVNEMDLDWGCARVNGKSTIEVCSLYLLFGVE